MLFATSHSQQARGLRGGRPQALLAHRGEVSDPPASATSQQQNSPHFNKEGKKGPILILTCSCFVYKNIQKQPRKDLSSGCDGHYYSISHSVEVAGPTLSVTAECPGWMCSFSPFQFLSIISIHRLPSPFSPLRSIKQAELHREAQE